MAIISLSITYNDKEKINNNNLSNESQTQPILFNNSDSPMTHPKEDFSSLNRDEILKKSLKGYREETYWGDEHLISEKTKRLNDKDFSRFVQEEIKEKDVDVYWGAEY